MTFQDVRPSQSEQEFQTLAVWAKRLCISTGALLHHGAHGHLELFTLPQFAVDYFFVHEDFVSASHAATPYEAQPVLIADKNLMGFILTVSHCATLAAGQKIKGPLFQELMRKATQWVNILPAIPGRLGSKLRANGWRVAAYKRAVLPENGQWPEYSPTALTISASNVYIRDVDVQDFINRVKSFRFIDDLFVDNEIASELPSFVSGKLSEMVVANRAFWKDSRGLNPNQREVRRAEVIDFLKGDFAKLCSKMSKPKSLIKFAAESCDDSLLAKSQQLPTSFVTPALLALLTAAKLYWSAPSAHPSIPEMYPNPEYIISFLRFMGVTTQNGAAFGRTLIRPEKASYPKGLPVHTLRRGCQGLRR
jgi:hypothetical protein